MADRRIEPREGVEVYLGKTGLICIRQLNNEPEDDQPVVVLEPSQVPDVVAFLQQTLDEYLQNRKDFVDQAAEGAG